jgi:acetyl esterase/lipase
VLTYVAVITTVNQIHLAFCRSLALGGLAVVMVDFRNAYLNGKHNPFPIGLNDCAAAAKYVAEHKAEFGMKSFITYGESGGGNLALAIALKAKKEGWVNLIDGVYGMIPYISGGYHWPKERRLKEIPSTVASDGKFTF